MCLTVQLQCCSSPICCTGVMTDLLCHTCSPGGCWLTHTREVLPRGGRCCKRPLASLREEDLDSRLAASQTSTMARISRTGWTAHTLVSAVFALRQPLFRYSACSARCVQVCSVPLNTPRCLQHLNRSKFVYQHKFHYYCPCVHCCSTFC